MSEVRRLLLPASLRVRGRSALMSGLHCCSRAAACSQLWMKLSGVFGTAPVFGPRFTGGGGGGGGEASAFDVLDVD